MCHNSIFKPKYSQASLYLRQLLSITENPKNYILKGLPNMELLTKFFHEILVYVVNSCFWKSRSSRLEVVLVKDIFAGYFQNTFFQEHLGVAASEKAMSRCLL